MNKEKCKNGFHGSLAEDLSRIQNGEPLSLCPECGRNEVHEKFIEACEGLNIDPKMI